jgi:Dioxygenase
MDRRHFLELLGGAGVVVLVGCAPSNKGTARSTTTTSTSGGTSSGPSGNSGTGDTPIPEETAGPFPGDGSNGPNVLTQRGIVRRDITSSFGSASGVAEGVPTTLNLTVLDASTGKPLADAAVYVWHCDREGRYSLYSDGVTDENYLRGVQATSAAGVATFDTIFPACYSGRWPHIHLEVYRSIDDATSAGAVIATSQLAIPAATCAVVFATTGYEASVENFSQISLDSDNVFGDDGGVHELATVTGSVADGYVFALSAPVQFPTQGSSS